MSDDNPDSVVTQDLPMPVMVCDRVFYSDDPTKPALAAIVCYVHENGSLNLAVFDSMGLVRPELSVEYNENATGDRSWAFPPRRPRPT